MTPRPSTLRRATALAASALALAGCRTERYLVVESVPPGATVRLDENVVGTTPLEHPFEHYGERRLGLYLPGYRTHTEVVEIAPPLRARFPLDLLTEVILPLGLTDRQVIEVRLLPDTGEEARPDAEAFLARARAARAEAIERAEARVSPAPRDRPEPVE